MTSGGQTRVTASRLRMIADCDPDRCFEEGLELMLAGLATAPATSRKRRHHPRA